METHHQQVHPKEIMADKQRGHQTVHQEAAVAHLLLVKHQRTVIQTVEMGAVVRQIQFQEHL
jgi:hypothetical protein